MPRPASTETKVRLNLELPQHVRERAEHSRIVSEADSLTEVVRRSLAIYEELLLRSEEGATVLLRKDGEEDRELVLR